MIAATEKSLRRPDFVALVSADIEPGELERIQAAVSAAKEAMRGDDRDAIHRRTHELNDVTRHLAEVMMNRGVREALAGKNISEIETVGSAAPPHATGTVPGKR